MFLVGDIGGTKTRLALYRREGCHVESVAVETYVSAEFGGLAEILDRFLEDHDVPVEAACFGAPGPVTEGRVDPTNLSWEIDVADLKRHLGMDEVRLVNDLVVTAAAIPCLAERQVRTLHPGEPDQGREQRYVVVAPGTGLGQSFLVMRDGVASLHPSEGGHVDFAPTNREQLGLLEFLMERFPRVSYERVLSGPGLQNIYDYLLERVYREEPEEMKARFAREDRSRAISVAGIEGRIPIARHAVDLFTAILGSHAANQGLVYRANGGVYLGGGIPPKMISKLEEGGLVAAFLEKDPMSEEVRRMPLRVIMDDHAALAGAAFIAAAAAGREPDPAP